MTAAPQPQQQRTTSAPSGMRGQAATALQLNDWISLHLLIRNSLAICFCMRTEVKGLLSCVFFALRAKLMCALLLVGIVWFLAWESTIRGKHSSRVHRVQP